MTTIVSSIQLGAIAGRLGALYDETLTGFKWIANRAMERATKDGAEFVFGYEEALGYTVGTLVRDKDGIGSALVMADLAGWARARGTTVLGYLEEIQREFGVYALAPAELHLARGERGRDHRPGDGGVPARPARAGGHRARWSG